MSLRVGFIGTGGIARNHLNNLKQLEVDFVAMSDVDLERAKQAADEFGGRAFDDYNRMLDEVEMDACFICVPPFAHGDPERAVIERGIHMLVEKPIALQMELALELEEKAAQAGIITSVGYQWRYQQSVATAKEKWGDGPSA